jgi:ABC-type uncharacterized transport system permease subunit
VSLDLHFVTAVVYLAAAVMATLGLAGRNARLARAAVAALALGALLHAVAFLSFHDFQIPPPSTGLPGAVSLMAWLGTVFYLVVGAGHRLQGLAVLVAPAAFVGVFFSAVSRPSAAAATPDPAWASAHILLASAGLALLGVAAAAGMLFVIHHRALKAKRRGTRLPLPPLEALDRVQVLAVSLGFLLLTLSVVTGALWVLETDGRLWPGTPHATATLVAWAIYAVLVGARRMTRQGARQSALSAALGFAFLMLAVVGVEVLR